MGKPIQTVSTLLHGNGPVPSARSRQCHANKGAQAQPAVWEDCHEYELKLTRVHLQFYLPPLPSRTFPSVSLPGPSNRNRRVSLTRAEKEERDELEQQIERRREIYQHELYCKVSTVSRFLSPRNERTEAFLEFVSLITRDLF